ncbi:hypothetical protein EB796_008110 [Bugula neritina]|uniref:Uncharacterized protein n=1 Tax=Bugula neritina TaxID=10212 RepID=A0A7J7K5Q9_BUGNE|nr:hypothetical protein EB796_008110 [Bugula neritina]
MWASLQFTSLFSIYLSARGKEVVCSYTEKSCYTCIWFVSVEFNNCPEDEPFPCKSTNKCISLKHVCDGNYDCPERWDEDQEVCIAYQRVPAEDMLNFVEQQARWLIPAFFKSIVKSRDDLQKIASALSTSANIDVFQSKLHLSRQSARDFESALYAVRSNDMGTLEEFGMKPESWSEVKSVFKNLIDSGLLQQ